MQNQNPNNDSEQGNVKLVFDVMPGTSPTQNLEPERMEPAMFKNPVRPPVLAPPAPPPPADETEQKTGNRPAILNKWLYIGIAILIVLGVGGYFGYKYFLSASEKKPAAVEVVEPVLPPTWLTKYFGTQSCDEQNWCGTGADPDLDGLTNFEELHYGTSPIAADSDFDGLADGDEIRVYSTDPKVADTDGDGFEDGNEIRNGYSPLMPKEKISTVEKQQIDDNIIKSRLHEPTVTFMTLKPFITKFEPASTTTPQISLSVPKDWVLSGSDDAKILHDPTATSSEIQIYILPFNPATEGDRNAAWTAQTQSIQSSGKGLGSSAYSIGQIQISASEYQYYVAGTTIPEYHFKRIMFLKAGRLFDILVSAKETSWDSIKNIANTIINSVR